MSNDKQLHSNGNHMVLRLFFCLIPRELFAIVRYFSIGPDGLVKFSGLLFFICPIMHLLMMKGNMGHEKGKCHRDYVQNNEIG